MIKLLASVALVSLPLSLLPAGSASAAECNLLGGVITNCTRPSSSPPPSSSSPPPSSSQPQPSQPQPSRPAGTPIAEVPGAAERLMELVNGERTSRGMVALSIRGDVVAIAGPHSTDMARRRTIWHNDGYFTESTRSSLRSRARGENVAMNSSLEDAHRRLMNSPAHRANILNGGFTQAGFSVVHDESGTLYVTQNFMTPETPEAAAPAKSSKAKATKSKATAGKSKATAGKSKAKAKRAKASRAKRSRTRVAKAGAPRRARTAQRARR
ncbi:MAG: CAP domain-containing protein [Actinomycetota bacterium]|nr:CAP domain-containing protein [Actinomycetota bacterium]PLS76233.1 MAG: hypothetical protein CYG61_03350 [Actinomycetota bacterium]